MHDLLRCVLLQPFLGDLVFGFCTLIGSIDVGSVRRIGAYAWFVVSLATECILLPRSEIDS